MATLSDLKEVKEALDAGLVSQAEYDDVKRDYLTAKKEAVEFQRKALRAKEESQKKELCAKEESQKRELLAKEEFQKKALRAKDDALEANKECQKMELRAKKEALDANKEFQKRELIAKEAFQQRKDEADLRTSALEAIVKHGSSLMSEEQKVDLVRDYAKMSGLDGVAENVERASKRQRIKAEPRDASPPQTETPASTSAATNQAPWAPAPSTSTGGVVINEWTWLLHKSGLDCGTAEGDASPPQRQPSIPPAPAAVPSPADAPVSADEDEYSNCSADDGEDDSDYDEPTNAERCMKMWTEDHDDTLVAALRADQSARSIRIGGRGADAARNRLHRARENGLGSPALREYLEETCPEYVYKGPPQKPSPWSVEEDQTVIQAHKEGKTFKEIAAMLPGRNKVL